MYFFKGPSNTYVGVIKGKQEKHIETMQETSWVVKKMLSDLPLMCG